MQAVEDAAIAGWQRASTTDAPPPPPMPTPSGDLRRYALTDEPKPAGTILQARPSNQSLRPSGGSVTGSTVSSTSTLVASQASSTPPKKGPATFEEMGIEAVKLKKEASCSMMLKPLNC